MGLVLYAFILVGSAIGTYGQSVHKINKEVCVPRATRMTLGKLDYNRHEKYPAVTFKQVVNKSKEEVKEWRELRSQHDENGYWLSPKAI